ncbi:MAG: hypothetical protein HC799_08515 [Limnothrix sp. RL_2_0]|nr:hypothetical protein [Limnothrix sp. RL_2_0]
MFKRFFTHQISHRKGVGHFLLGCSLLALGLAPVKAQANTSFSSQGISFDQDTVVEFEFIQSHGSYRTVFGMIDRNTNQKQVIFQENQPYDDYQFQEYLPNIGMHDTGSDQDYVGTFGKTVTSGSGLVAVKAFGKPNGQVVEVPFKANHQYVFFLDVFNERGQLVNQLLSTQNVASFNGDLEGGSGSRNGYGDRITGISLLWEDGGRLESESDFDFDDFVVEAGGFLFDPCPDVN